MGLTVSARDAEKDPAETADPAAQVRKMKTQEMAVMKSKKTMKTSPVWRPVCPTLSSYGGRAAVRGCRG